MNTSSVASIVLSAQCAIEWYIRIAVRSLDRTSQCVIAALEKETIESHQRAQIWRKSAIRNAEIAGNVIGISAASTVKPWWFLGRSTV